jgi:hypothetical protein
MPSSKHASTKTPAASQAITKKRAQTPKLCYIIGATGPDFSISDADLELVQKQRAKDHVWKHPVGDAAVINGFETNDVEGGDLHMRAQLMHYLASKSVKPVGPQRCTAFAHTSNLKLKAEFFGDYVRDGSFGPFADKPMATLLKFDETVVLKAVLEQERKSGGFFAPFAQSHVQKTLHIAHNTFETTDVECEGGARRNFFSIYFVKLRVLTGFGIMTARGELKLHGPLQPSKVEYDAHVNWHSWGFTAEDCWNGGTPLRSVGHPSGF